MSKSNKRQLNTNVIKTRLPTKRPVRLRQVKGNQRFKMPRNVPRSRNIPRNQFVVNRANASVSVGTQLTSQDPEGTMSGGISNLRHREPLGKVVMAPGNATTVTTLPINPGLSIPFPWLSGMAPLYELYKIHRIWFEFISRSPSILPGRLIIAPEYDSADLVIANLEQLEQMQESYSNVVWNNGICKLNPSTIHAMAKWKYNRTGELAENLDIKTYDICKLYVATDGNPGTEEVIIGEIWVNYDITFRTPQPVGFGGSQSLFLQNSTGEGIEISTPPMDWAGVIDQKFGNIDARLIRTPEFSAVIHDEVLLFNLTPGQNYLVGMCLHANPTAGSLMSNEAEIHIRYEPGPSVDLHLISRLRAAGLIHYLGSFVAANSFAILEIRGGLEALAWTDPTFMFFVISTGDYFPQNKQKSYNSMSNNITILNPKGFTFGAVNVNDPDVLDEVIIENSQKIVEELKNHGSSSIPLHFRKKC